MNGRACGRTRRVWWPGSEPREVTEEVERAQRHLASCAACRDFVEETRALRAVLRRHAPRPPAPAPVRDRVFGAVALERVGGAADRPNVERRRRAGGSDRGSRRVWFALTLAAVLLAAVTGYAAVHRWRAPDRLGTYVEDHLRSLHRESVRSSDPEVVRRWLSRRVTFPVVVPRLPSARLEGGRLCFLDGRQGVVVHYRIEGKLLSYYVMPGDGSGSAASDAEDFRSEAKDGYHVVVWRGAGLTHALVADLPRRRLGELARLCSGGTAARPTAPDSGPALAAAFAATSFSAP